MSQSMHPVDDLFHRLWTKAVGTDDYVKAEWKKLGEVITDHCYPRTEQPLDALCAAAGLGLEAGEVAGWTRTEAGPVMGWTLQTRAGAVFFCDDAGMAALGRRVPALATTGLDASASLKACWEALCLKS